MHPPLGYIFIRIIGAGREIVGGCIEEESSIETIPRSLPSRNNNNRTMTRFRSWISPIHWGGGRRNDVTPGG